MGDEIKAMGGINDALRELEPEETKRVLRWAVDKFGEDDVVLAGAKGASGGSGRGSKGGGAGSNNGDEDLEPAQFERISDLMDAANPSQTTDYVLLGAYWFQEVESNENITGQQVNGALKDLGHGASNITTTFTQLMARKPPLARQVQKAGSTKQARKRYRLTNEGIRAVERMVAGKSEE